MISSRQSKLGKAGKAKTVLRRKGSNRQPEWDPTIHDLSGMRLNEREQAKRHVAHMSKNRVQVPEGHQDRQGGHVSQKCTDPGAAWLDNSPIIFSAVVRDLQAAEADEQSGSHSNRQPGSSHGRAASDSQDADCASQPANEDARDDYFVAQQAPQTGAQPSDRSNKFGALPSSTADLQHSHRQRAEASVTTAPEHNDPPSTSSSSQSGTVNGDSQQHIAKPDSSGITNSGANQPTLLHANQTGSHTQSPSASSERPKSSQPKVSDSQNSTALNTLSSTEQQLEAKLSILTDRLHAAEEAAGSHNELQQQLQGLKQDKDALQADMKQFTDHISSMLTTLQSQVSKLLLTDPGQYRGAHQATAQRPAVNSIDQGSLGTLSGQWNLESHGAAPSPLAQHQTFQSSAQAMPRATSDAPISTADTASMPPVAVSVNGQSQCSMPDQATFQPQTGQSEPSQADDCIFDDEAGLPSFAQLAACPSAPLPPHAHAQLESPRTWAAQPMQSQPQGPWSDAAAHTGLHILQSLTVPHGHVASRQGLYQKERQLAGLFQQSVPEPTSLQSLPVQTQRCRPAQAAHYAPRWQPPAAGLPDFGLTQASEPRPSPLPQRFVGIENRQPDWVQQSTQRQAEGGKQGLKEVIMPRLRHRGLPHAAVPQSGTYQGSPALRLKPMSVGQPPLASVVNKHDSLALSAWAADPRNHQG